jgi:hypothetical protein
LAPIENILTLLQGLKPRYLRLSDVSTANDLFDGNKNLGFCISAVETVPTQDRVDLLSILVGTSHLAV